ncbi:hypothetical protein PTSG_03469 [Salpingoeca rosetta]|uniref:TauD/TfdA-like domain-containing protein n=1 Tax=Salpingoeca rosetta (strain ATCC 50818 / BSB-021) TaxID=946362 RepID=F2U5A3_SALR5|nr:uncharacterized protein PTSG_03469 [Salpingoeca rosetta]EGD82819.1 hypothetical protein PTSG_03469 [Salpingoeca rosetta]|eukprot:XP_004996054.1 hypothetical protein PTSG_03469 [Salpingoeca rosetta]
MAQQESKRSKEMIGELGEVGSLAPPQQRTFNDVAVPLVVKCTHQPAAVTMDGVCEWIKKNQSTLEEKLKHHGAILFRGFPLTTAQHFDSFVCSFQSYKDLPYSRSLSFAVRIQVTDRVCTTNEGKKGGQVFHHEQAQTPYWPSKLFFFCERPATTGGGTAVCPSDIVCQRVKEKHPEFYRHLEEHGVKYTSYMAAQQDTSKGAGRSWKSFFGRDTKEAVEEHMRELGYTWRWLEDDTLAATSPVLKGIRTAPGTDKVVFFNQIVATIANASEFSGTADSGDSESSDKRLARFICFGDDEPMPYKVLLDIKAMCEDAAVELEWQPGDVALLDNYLVMHARRAFDGPRRVLASLVE